MWLMIPEGWPPRWWAWYRPVRRHLCWLLKHQSGATDFDDTHCRWCRRHLRWGQSTRGWKGWYIEGWPDPESPEDPEPPTRKLSGPKGPLP